MSGTAYPYRVMNGLPFGLAPAARPDPGPMGQSLTMPPKAPYAAPSSQQDMIRALLMPISAPLYAGMGVAAVPGAFAGAAEALPGAESLARRALGLYNPPVKAPRPFGADYPAGAPSDAAGRLTRDIEGRPLTAQWISGRTSAGAPDQAIPPDKLEALAEALTGSPPQSVSAANLGRQTLGAFDPRRLSIGIAQDAAPDQLPQLLAHETGHAIDYLGGAIPKAGIKRELGQIYNDLNNRQSWGPRVSPIHFGYTAQQASNELNAEAIRAYLTDPNYIKTVAPNVAARIREYVNSNPRLAPIIQFNAALPFALAPQQARSNQ